MSWRKKWNNICYEMQIIERNHCAAAAAMEAWSKRGRELISNCRFRLCEKYGLNAKSSKIPWHIHIHCFNAKQISEILFLHRIYDFMGIVAAKMEALDVDVSIMIISGIKWVGMSMRALIWGAVRTSRMGTCVVNYSSVWRCFNNSVLKCGECKYGE